MKKISLCLIIMFVFMLSLVSVSADPNFDIKILDQGIISGSFPLDVVDTDDSGLQSERQSLALRVRNLGTTGGKKIECGIYLRSTVASWYGGNLPLSIGVPTITENCISSESNVQTKFLTLEAGDSKVIKFQVQAPSTDDSPEYVWHCQAFDACWKDAPGETGVTDYAIREFDLKDAGRTSESCSDGIKNQNEVDTDCGGICTKGCFIGQLCEEDSDCIENQCTKGRCVLPDVDSDVESDADSTNQDKDFQIPWNKIILVGLIIFIALVILIILSKLGGKK